MANPQSSLALSLALVLASGAGCAAEDPLAQHGQPIVNGTPTTGSPATVYLDLGGGSCSGTLITPKVVLTAAHCLQDNPALVKVYFGANAGTQGGTWINAIDYEFHPQGDIGILTLASPGPTTPVPVFGGPMGSLDQHIDKPVHIVGFGVTSENGSDSGLKREGLTKLHHLEGDVMFTGHDLAGSWTCYGDSGGPNYMTLNGVELVIGATSFGTTVCGMPSDGAVRTDTYYDWIMAYIAAHDAGTCSADGRCVATGCPTPDPDCACAMDGTCSVACVGWETNDPDCSGCAAGGTCRNDCPVVDTDCCAADGACNEVCGTADTDCGGGGGGGGEGGGGEGGGGEGGGGGGEGGGEGNPGDATGGCSVAAGDGSGPGAAGAWVLLALCGLILARRRSRPAA